MPIIIPEDCHDHSFYNGLEADGAVVMSEEEALSQDVRPARIGILNLMPGLSMEDAERQWLRYMSQTWLQIEPVLVKFDDDQRESNGGRRASRLEAYTPFSEVAEAGLDALIITGDNLELSPDAPEGRPQLLPFDSIRYADELRHVMEWAQSNVFSTIYSCLASHFALDHFYDLRRDEPTHKTFGVFHHRILEDAPRNITRGLDDKFTAPHSRWGNVRPELLGAAAIDLIAVNDEIGWLLAQASNDAGGQDLFIQGHPEYRRMTLHWEYQRDKANGQEPPVDYYYDNDQQRPALTWANDARALHANWIGNLYQHFSKSEGSAIVTDDEDPNQKAE